MVGAWLQRSSPRPNAYGSNIRVFHAVSNSHHRHQSLFSIFLIEVGFGVGNFSAIVIDVIILVDYDLVIVRMG